MNLMIFLNLIFLSFVNLSDVTYEGIDISSPDVTQGASVCPVVTLVGMVSRCINRVSQIGATGA
jgi:hypothetical protein